MQSARIGEKIEEVTQSDYCIICGHQKSCHDTTGCFGLLSDSLDLCPCKAKFIERNLELANVEKAAEILADGLTTIGLAMGELIQGIGPALKQLELRYVVSQHLLKVMDMCQGNKALAAKVLGVDRRTIYRMLKKVQKDAPASDQPVEEEKEVNGSVDRHGL